MTISITGRRFKNQIRNVPFSERLRNYPKYLVGLTKYICKLLYGLRYFPPAQEMITVEVMPGTPEYETADFQEATIMGKPYMGKQVKQEHVH